MKLVAILSLASLFATVPAKVHPVASVIKLLDELQSKVEKEGEAEHATWLKFKKWCTESGGKLGAAVTSDKNSIDQLNDYTAGKEREQESLNSNIAHLSDEIAKYEAESLAANKMRKEGAGLYHEADTAFETTIKAVTAALKALKESKTASLVQFLKPENRDQEHALRQLIQLPLVLEQLSDDQREELSAAVFGPVTDADILAKEKYAKSGKTYTFKSGGVIGLLSKLKAHFEVARENANKKETVAANEHDVDAAARSDALSAAEKTKNSKTTLLAEVTKDLGTGMGYLKEEKGELKDDSTTKADTAMTCRLKEDDFNKRNDMRAHEMAALKAAEDVLAKVTGVRSSKPTTDKLPSLPKGPELSLLQRPASDVKVKAVETIRAEAIHAHSKELTLFAEQLEAKLDGPSDQDQIGHMVQKMIFRLMAEQKSEDEHKHWCDLEMSNSEKSAKDKKAKVASLDSKIDDAKATSAELGLKIKELNQKQADLSEYIAEATEVRKEGKQENALALTDADAAQAAITKAISVLEDFYKDSGMIAKEAWEFLQVDGPLDKMSPDGAVSLPDSPASWTKSYTGTVNPNDPTAGVISVLEATAADFAKMEADTRNQENTDQSQYEKDMKAATIDKASTTKESEMKADEKKRTDDNASSMEHKRKHVDSEHGAVTQYIKDLQDSCVSADSKYSDRKNARSEEMEALREAQVTLESR